MPHEPSTGTDFVQDYAAKRAAQLERAKKIREERIQSLQLKQDQEKSRCPQTQKSSSDYGSTRSGVPLSDHERGQSSTSPSQPGSISGAPGLHPPARSRRIANVVEEDFKRATRAGIITPDQARQLWAMLSDQLVQVDNTRTNSLSTSLETPLGTVCGESPADFHNSISMASLRASIAQFKEQQMKKSRQRDTADMAHPSRRGGENIVSSNGGDSDAYRGKGSGGRNNSNGSFSGVTEAYEVATRVFAPPSSGAVSGTVGAAMSRPARRELRSDRQEWLNRREECEDAEEEDEWVLRKSPARGRGGRSGKQQKPAWNYDVTVSYGKNTEAEELADDSLQARPQQQVKPQNKKTTQSQQLAGYPLPFDETPVGGGGFSTLELPCHTTQQQAFGSKTDGPVAKKKMTSSCVASKANCNIQRGAPPQCAEGKPSVSLDDVVVGGGGAYKLDSAALPPPTNEPLLPCGLCGRTFRSSILARHEKACSKVQKKRRVFDMKGQRLEGIEGIREVLATSFAGHGRGPKKQSSSVMATATTNNNPNLNKLPKWKIQHEQFQAAMRAIRQMNTDGGTSGGDVSAPAGKKCDVVQPVEYDDRVPCPHCGRKFAQLTAERHIPKCATTIAKPKGLRPAR
ncbi:putative zinc finger of a C2HC type [Trypanosoma vivax]|uniref:C2HC/C3H-type domain-containing protein n=1 Tax=Trypanosoma vivax (strain Y486) TaxID=1055687 RepID=G0TZF7_TRYVY|nr:putative zinc finger of a C2HC type [Trypanosoma vivax]CCC49360.1 conserved hypothetical protein [Trypanosoma vivax Y486]